MAGRKTFWTLVSLFFFFSFITSNGVEWLADYIWFGQEGYREIYLRIFSAEVLIGSVVGLITFAFLAVNLSVAVRQLGDPDRFLPPELLATPLRGWLRQGKLRGVVVGVSAVFALIFGLSASTGWEKPLLFLKAQPFGEVDPLFGKDVGFYIFTLPVLDQIQTFLWVLGMFTVMGVGSIYFIRMQSEKTVPTDVISLSTFPQAGRTHFGLLGGFVLLVMAGGLYLERFEILHASGGLFSGPGYMDINAILPVLALKVATVLVSAGLLAFALARNRLRMLMGVAGLWVVVWVGGNLYGSMLQKFVVTPNELEKERPYLQNHIEATNKAFGLDKVEERALTEDEDLTAANISANRPTINNVRLWDHEPLLDTFAQIQEIRTYYEFVSVDNDRYMIDGELRQTMLSPREMSAESLPSRTWVNERLTYTHGYGLTAGPVNRVNEQGLPVLFVQDLPPKSRYGAMEIKEPEIYFGELTNSYVYTKTRQKEFNYPEGDANIFSDYSGKGGIPLDSLERRLIFSMYLRDVKLLLSEDFTPDTRLMVHRNIAERVRKIAPFFTFDDDPYLVIHEGRLVWILDGYTISRRYPYSELVNMKWGVGNYMRNPFKVTVDAKDGTVTFYLVHPDEPIARAYGALFPELFHPMSEMPEGIKAHLRHPPVFFSVQTHMYSTYHMQDVNTFYNKEDQWSIPVVENKRMEPYFTVMKLPGEKREEFILMVPVTPRLKDNLAAWMVARSDGANLGKLVVYTFPKQKLVYGPKQMSARINQDPAVSQQITLWDQSGSNVIRGTLLVIPIESSLIYIQPLYLKAQDGRIPELKRVVVGYQNKIAMGLDLEDALGQIFGGDGGRKPSTAERQASATALAASLPPSGKEPNPGNALSAQALRQYQSMQESARQGDWVRFGRELQDLGKILERLAKEPR